MAVSPSALGITFGLLWGSTMGVIGFIHVLHPDFGQEFMRLMASLYPFLTDAATIGNAVLGAFYGLVDGLVGGYVVAWVYNWALRKTSRK